MDPAIEHGDLRPPPPPGLSRGVLLAIVAVHVVLVAALLGSVESKRRAGEPAAVAAAGAVRPTSAATGAEPPPARALAVAAPGASPARTACPSHPLLAATGDRDAEPSSAGGNGQDIDALLVAGKEAAAAGQPHHAEVDFLAACRLADASKGPDSAEAAEARYQLARHYLGAARAAGTAPSSERAELLAQSEALYADSLRRFRARYGDRHEKSRFAAEGLEAARVALQHGAPSEAPIQTVATAAAGAGAAEPPGAAPQPAQAPAATRRVAAPRPAPPHAPPRQAVAHRAAPAPVTSNANARPSFNCAKARSYSERKICADPQLARLDRELGRLYARAKRAAVDPAAFQRQSDAQWRRREQTCRDRNCLVRWYAQRREQLAQSLAFSDQRGDRTASR